jgi:DNA-cytosine methyltransferase
MRELALFAGAGGGILGGYLLGWQTVCAVEIEDYARRVLFARQRDGILPRFPIWDDIRTFDGRPWSGRVDIVSGGFPCQDISVAGKGAGLTGERSGLWSEMARIIGEVRPRFAFVENVPALTGRGLGTVLGDLADLGYDARWCVLGADDAGAPHHRKRIWILAYTGCERRQQDARSASCHEEENERRTAKHNNESASNGEGENVSHPSRPIEQPRAGRGRVRQGDTVLAESTDDRSGRRKQQSKGGKGAGNVADTEAQRRDHGATANERTSGGESDALGDSGEVLAQPTLDGRKPRRQSDTEEGPRTMRGHGTQTDVTEENRGGSGAGNVQWWSVEPGLGGTSDGMAEVLDLSGVLAEGWEMDTPKIAEKIKNRVDRLKCIGNGQVPQTAAIAFIILSEQLVGVENISGL